MKNQTFAEATEWPGNVYDVKTSFKVNDFFTFNVKKYIKLKGILGMAFNSASTGTGNSSSGDPTVFQNLINQHQLERNVFSFYLNR